MKNGVAKATFLVFVMSVYLGHVLVLQNDTLLIFFVG